MWDVCADAVDLIAIEQQNPIASLAVKVHRRRLI
jgi:hypothetical protein